jgi:transcriptional regulator with XRE-family HTH domain
MSIGERIRLVRGDRSQKWFAETIGVAQNTVGYYERGERTPNADVVVTIADIFGLSYEWLLAGKGTMLAGFPSDQQESAPSPAEPGRCPHCTKSEKMADDLRSELSKERDMNRELVAENRQLWKENGELKAEVSTLRAEARAAPTPAESNRRIA